MTIRPYGFTLGGLLIAVLLTAILASLALPAYYRHIKEARLKEAYAALLQNAQSMERFYQQNQSFLQNTNSWASLPVTQTDTFCLRPHGSARGASEDKFTLKAVALNPEDEPRVLKINESLNVSVCESSESRCDSEDFFSGNDKDCEPYQP